MAVDLKLHVLNKKKDQPQIAGRIHSGGRSLQMLIHLKLIPLGLCSQSVNNNQDVYWLKGSPKE